VQVYLACEILKIGAKAIKEVRYGKAPRKEIGHGPKAILFPMKIGDTHKRLWMFLYSPHFLLEKCGYMDNPLEN
jgi:hypothetical protein